MIGNILVGIAVRMGSNIAMVMSRDAAAVNRTNASLKAQTAALEAQAWPRAVCAG